MKCPGLAWVTFAIMSPSLGVFWGREPAVLGAPTQPGASQTVGFVPRRPLLVAPWRVQS